jgi:hypothetical protein
LTPLLKEKAMLCEIGYRHISRDDYNIPLIYLPMQRMRLEVDEPFGAEQVRDAVIKYFGSGWFDDRNEIQDIECYPLQNR